MKVELLDTVNHDGRDYGPGEVLEVTDAQAEALVHVGSAKVSKTGKPAGEAAARAEAESLVAEARKEAETIVSEARAEAEKTLADAKAEADKTRAEADKAAQPQPGQQSLHAVPKKDGK